MRVPIERVNAFGLSKKGVALDIKLPLHDSHAGIGAALDEALRSRECITPLTEQWPSLSIDDAYAISLEFLRIRVSRGDIVIGKKIGATSKAVQEMLGVYQPDFGFLLASMRLEDGGICSIKDHLIQPRAEAEIAFVLKADLCGPDINEEDVLNATESIAPCIEIVDSRIKDWRIGIVDTVADNASCGAFVLGASSADPRAFDLAALEGRFFKNGAEISRGKGSEVQGSPLTAVAWLANTLGRYGVPLNAGDVILSGSLVPLEPAAAGDHFEMELINVGRCGVHFV